MGARQKLNRMNLAGDVALAGVLGMVVQSWLAFFLGLALLVAFDVRAGAIRPKKRNCDVKRGGRS